MRPRSKRARLSQKQKCGCMPSDLMGTWCIWSRPQAEGVVKRNLQVAATLRSMADPLGYWLFTNKNKQCCESSRAAVFQA